MPASLQYENEVLSAFCEKHNIPLYLTPNPASVSSISKLLIWFKGGLSTYYTKLCRYQNTPDRHTTRRIVELIRKMIMQCKELLTLRDPETAEFIIEKLWGQPIQDTNRTFTVENFMDSLTELDRRISEVEL